MPKQLTLREAYDEYERFKRNVSKTKEISLKSRRTALSALLRMYGDRKLHTLEVGHMVTWLGVAGETRSNRSLETTHSAAAMFFNHCIRVGMLRRSPWEGITAPDWQPIPQLRIPEHRFPELLSAADSVDPLFRAMVAIGLFACSRDTEIRMLQVKDLTLPTSRLNLYVLKKRGGIIRDNMRMSNVLDKEMRRWLNHYQSSVGQLDGEYMLIPARAKVQMKDPATGLYVSGEVRPYLPTTKASPLYRPVKEIIGKLGYGMRDEDDDRSLGIGAHTLRRSGARAIYDRAVAMKQVDALEKTQTQLHHDDIKQTQHYIGLELNKQTRDEFMAELTFGFEELPSIGLEAVGNGQHHEEGQSVAL